MREEKVSDSHSGHVNSWSVAVICSVIRFFLSGTRRIGPLLYIECIHQFKISRKIASIPFVISFMLIFLTGPLVGYLGSRFQLRSVILTGCVLSSIGIGANFWADDIIAVTVFWGIFFGSGICIGSSLLPEVLNRRFTKNISSANGITYAGSSVGAAVLPVVARFLIQKYDVFGAFLILGGLTLNTIPAAILIGTDPKNDPDEAEKSFKEEKDSYVVNSSVSEKTLKLPWVYESKVSEPSVKLVETKLNSESNRKNYGCGAFRIFQDSTFIAILITQSFFIGIMAIMNTIIIDYCMDKNITADEGVYILLGLAVTDIAGRLGLGWISDFGLVTVVTFVMICFFGLGLNFLLFVWSDGLLMCMLSSVVFGLLTGGIMSHSPALIKLYIRKEHRTMAVASRYLLFAPLILTMPSFLGYFRDSDSNTVGSYDGVMYILVAIAMLSGAVTYFIPHLSRRALNRAKTSPTEDL